MSAGDVPREKRGAFDRLGVSPGLLLSVCVWIWAMVELPWEFAGCEKIDEALALVLSKAILGTSVFFALRGLVLARSVVIFICATSVVAIVPSISTEYDAFRLGFYLSVIECVLKGATLLILLREGAAKSR
ncbi:hypothetical protein [Paraburkholderia pallida]|uniref:Uncharacterized protein n=1 Tax=Paraburkholderia pallida TaxID=2547399 RepID=A0A4P7D4G9_9BURK|nr:hypothetical protein [Paraburkholderia pallida]QBR03681.1 hypothetical protein E1956_42000 [Paraburkholderia pallida]